MENLICGELLTFLYRGFSPDRNLMSLNSSACDSWDNYIILSITESSRNALTYNFRNLGPRRKFKELCCGLEIDVVFCNSLSIWGGSQGAICCNETAFQ
jgi:hypothetical protein